MLVVSIWLQEKVLRDILSQSYCINLNARIYTNYNYKLLVLLLLILPAAATLSFLTTGKERTQKVEGYMDEISEFLYGLYLLCVAS